MTTQVVWRDRNGVVHQSITCPLIPVDETADDVDLTRVEITLDGLDQAALLGLVCTGE